MVEKNKLPRKFSLKSKIEIGNLLKTGNKISGDCFTIVWKESNEFKFAVLIPKKYGPAVKRNRLKRLIKESIRLNKDVLTGSVKIAVLHGKENDKLDFNKLNAEINRIFKLINNRT